MRYGRLIVVACAAALLVALAGCGSGTGEVSESSAPPMSAAEEVEAEVRAEEEAANAAASSTFVQETFTNRRTINYVSSDPPNNALLASPPAEVRINFSKGLGAGSFIDVTRADMKVNAGQVMISDDNLSMHVPVAAGVTGNYKVKYAAYFASGYYEEGSFGFSVQVQ